VSAALESDLGRNEIRVRAAPYPLTSGRTVSEIALVERLERLGYRRVHAKPVEPGTYFYGHETFWIFRRAHGSRGTDYRATLLDPLTLSESLAAGLDLPAVRWMAAHPRDCRRLDSSRRTRALQEEDLAGRVVRPVAGGGD
jgi:hypothetical protein